jgi:DNA adenine methylase
MKEHQFHQPLKWAGGKRKLLPLLSQLWLPYWDRRLVEPFAGGAAISFGLQASRVLLNDVNPHLINFYRWVQRGLTIDHEAMRMGVDRNHFKAQRDRFNSLISNGCVTSEEAARLFFYLNRACFNGLCRFNQRGEFNTPIGDYPKGISYPHDLAPYQRIIADWRFTAGDFESVALEPDDFVCADPPYDVEFVSYAADGFSWHDQQRLVAWLLHHPGPIVVSGQATARTVALYEKAGFNLSTRAATRGINSKAALRKVPAIEMVAVRNITKTRIDQRSEYHG